MKKHLAMWSIVLSLSGCMGLSQMIAPNPEIVRQKQETQRLEHTQSKIVVASTPEQVQAIVDTHNKTSKGSHPSFWSNAVSALYTREGQAMAGLILTTLAGMGVAIWKIIEARTIGIDLISTIRGIQKVRKQVPQTRKYADLIKETLTSEHEKAGSLNRMRRKVAKALGETGGKIA